MGRLATERNGERPRSLDPPPGASWLSPSRPPASRRRGLFFWLPTSVGQGEQNAVVVGCPERQQRVSNRTADEETNLPAPLALQRRETIRRNGEFFSVS